MPTRPLKKVLDLFSGAGGATRGYQLAGFHVVGVDKEPQPHYCGDEFIQADALTFPLDGDWDLIHASPPCQGYSQATAWRGSRDNHPRLIAPTRERLLERGLPYVIENVERARSELMRPTKLCGSMFQLPSRGHRYFEMLWLLDLPLLPACLHREDDHPRDHGGKYPESQFAAALGIDWPVTVDEAREAIPPAFTAWIGAQFLALREPSHAHWPLEGL